MENRKTCTHIKISGIRCGSPSLRGEQFCYYHQRMHRGVRTPRQSRLHPLACIEDKESIQSALAEVINALLRNTIDMKRATLILRALHIAVKNDARASIHAHASDMVKQVPEYDEAAGSYDSNGLFELEVPFEANFGQDPRAAKPHRSYKTPEEFARQRDETIANYYGYPTAEAHAAAKKAGWTPYSQNQETTTPNAKADAPVRPKPEPAASNAATTQAGTAPLISPTRPAATVSSAAATTPNQTPAGLNSTTRKPPTTVKEAPAALKGVRAATVASVRKSMP